MKWKAITGVLTESRFVMYAILILSISVPLPLSYCSRRHRRHHHAWSNITKK